MNRTAASAVIAAVLICRFQPAAWGSTDWFQGPNGNLAVATATANQWYPAAIPDGSGGAIVAWHDDRSGNLDIYVQHILGSGVVDPSWPSQGLVVCTATGTDQFPTLCTDGAGGAFVAWVNTAKSSVFAQHVLSTGMVDPGWTPGGDEVSAPASNLPRIASDGAGGAFLVWHTGVGATSQRVYAQHLNISGVDGAWIANGERVCTNEAGQGYPVVCSDGAGGAYVAWNDWRNADRDIYAQHLGVDGTRIWPAAGTAVCTATANQRLNGSFSGFILVTTYTEAQSNAIAPDGAGGFLATWADERNSVTTDINVYVQRINSAGVPAAGWSVDGVWAALVPGNQLTPQLVPDGTGGAIVLWDDARSGAFAQYVNGAGGTEGPTDGLLLDAQGARLSVAVNDGATGAILFAHRIDSGHSDLYAYHLLTTPSFAIDAGWPMGGLAVSTAAGDQILGTAVQDGAGGAIGIWVDTRDTTTTGYDIYAQRTLASGALPSNPAAVAEQRSGKGSLGVHPNPFTSRAAIRFGLTERSRVRIGIYDVQGRLQLDLMDGVREAGSHELGFTRTRAGLRAGVHFVRMRAIPLAGGPEVTSYRAFIVMD